jgi:hypothetical protein
MSEATYRLVQGYGIVNLLTILSQP